MQDLTNSTAASMSMEFSSPNRASAATAQKENRVSTSPHLSPESLGHTFISQIITYISFSKCLLHEVQKDGIRSPMLPWKAVSII